MATDNASSRQSVPTGRQFGFEAGLGTARTDGGPHPTVQAEIDLETPVTGAVSAHPSSAGDANHPYSRRVADSDVERIETRSAHERATATGRAHGHQELTNDRPS